MHETSFPFSVGGYRVGRRVGHGRYLGHALAPSLVELVFLNELSSEQPRIVCSEAQDFSSLSDGGRVAILPRPVSTAESLENPVHVRLSTPPDLVESWRHMEEATAAASTMSPPRDNDGNALLARVSGLLRRARRGPLVLAALAGVIVVVAVLALVPAAPSGTDSITESDTVSTTHSTSESNPFSSQLSNPPSTPTSMPTPASALVRSPTSAEPIEPLSSLGDFILVRVPAKSGQEPGEIAVLERSSDTWIVRETYPATLGAAQ